MLVYHGSPNKFSKFDYSRIRTNGTSEGVGFYFTDKESIARGYGGGGYLYTVELKGKKAISDNRKTITKAQVKKLLEAVEKNTTSYIENYGDIGSGGYNKVFNQALDNLYDYNDTDTEIMGELYNACGENEEIVKLFYTVLGYDHIESNPEWGGEQKIYIALTNDIINIKKVEKI